MRLSPKSPALISAGVILAAIWLWAGLTFPVRAQDAFPQKPDAIAGRAIYAQNCAPCHGTTGRGDGPSASGLGIPVTALADSEIVAARSLTEWFQITKNGNMPRMMPPWAGRLTDQQIWDVVAYAWTLHTSRTEVEMGRAVYALHCAGCHGVDGVARPPTPNLADFATTASVRDAAWAQVVANGKGTMPGFADKLSGAEQRAVLSYVRTLSFGTAFRGPLAPGSGVITGTVINGTTGQPLPNYPVQLGIFDQTTELETRSGSTDAAGVYRFSDLPTDPDLVYMARVAYAAGRPYGSEPLSFTPGQTALALPVTVYEVTSDPSGIRAERVHYILEFDSSMGQPQLLVAELLVFSLDGNRVYVGDGMAVLRFTLPAAAQEVEVSGSEVAGRFVSVEGGFVDTLPLLPGRGSRQVLYRYAIPLTGSTVEFVRSLAYPATNVNALIADVGQQVSSPQLVNQGVRQTQNGNYIVLAAESVAANQEVRLRLTGLPVGTGASTSSVGSGLSERVVLFSLLGLVGLVAAGLAAWTVRRQQASALQAEAATAEDLLAALADLQAAHAAGQVSEAAYRDQRLRLKAQLLDLASPTADK